jgi:GAF domain-containing protein
MSARKASGAKKARGAGAGPPPAVPDAAVRPLLEAVALRAEAARRIDLGSGEALLRSIADATVALFQAEAASIALYDPGRDRLVFHVAAGEQGQGVVGLEIPPGQGIAGYVYSSGQSLALADVEHDPRFGRRVAEQTGYIPRSIVAVPLIDGERTLGVLEVLDKRGSPSFSLQDIELAAVFAKQAAVAIGATRVERDVRALLRDALLALASGSLEDRTVDELVAGATAELDREDDSRLWALAERVARVRRADTSQLELVCDLLDVLARHAAASTARGRGGRGERGTRRR